ncbi:TetR/AcrR family transcriptional regulator [Kribbella sp. CA-253562]|uniref:TetR/AcrR family transcriptional regulator n=1 Tax=Kribbella sp. CA-253562 TaxID=3239942 RepID=UPI003D8C8E2B
MSSAPSVVPPDRKFPDRTELVEAVFLERGQTYLAVAQESLRIPDAWDAFRTYVERLSALQAEDRVVTDVLTLTAPEAPTLRRLRMRLHATQNRLIRAAQRQGSLRADFVPGTWCCCSSPTPRSRRRPASWHRRAGHASSAWPSTRSERATRRLSRRHRLPAA